MLPHNPSYPRATHVSRRYPTCPAVRSTLHTHHKPTANTAAEPKATAPAPAVMGGVIQDVTRVTVTGGSGECHALIRCKTTGDVCRSRA